MWLSLGDMRGQQNQILENIRHIIADLGSGVKGWPEPYGLVCNLFLDFGSPRNEEKRGLCAIEALGSLETTAQQLER